jgi:transcriptional regulator with XRE-family HTH domain
MKHLKEIGERIRQKRNQLGITQDALAQMAGYTSRSSINKIEKGLVDLPQSKLVEIADALLMPPSFLLGWDDDEDIADDDQITPEPTLTEAEQALLDLFRCVPAEQQEIVLAMIRAAVKKSPSVDEP